MCMRPPVSVRLRLGTVACLVSPHPGLAIAKFVEACPEYFTGVSSGYVGILILVRVHDGGHLHAFGFTLLLTIFPATPLVFKKDIGVVGDGVA